MNAGDIALSALGCLESGEAADRNELRSNTCLLQFAKQIVEPDAVAADDDEICELELASEQLHPHHGPGRHDFLVTADRREAVRSAECRHASRALAHWIRRQHPGFGIRDSGFGGRNLY